jgi:hypothetical protein
VATTLNTNSNPLVRLLSANDATVGTSIADPADTLTNPIVTSTGATASGIVLLGYGGSASPNWLKIVPYGTDTSAQTFLMAVYAIERVLGGPAGVPDSWNFRLLAGFTCTLGTKAGLAGAAVNGSQLYVTTITLNTNEGNANVSCMIVSPGSNREAHVVVDTGGAEAAKILFARNSSAISMNALVGKG